MTNLQSSFKGIQLKSLITQTAKDILDLHCTKDTKGHYSFNLYISYNDTLSDEFIHKILQSENPTDAFYEAVYDAYVDTIAAEETEIINKTVKVLQQNPVFEEDKQLSIEEAEDIIRDYIYTHVANTELYNHFLNQEAALNIVIDTGDLNTDFTENNLCNYYAPDPHEIGEGEEIVSDESSLLWLCETQGITKAELTDAIIEGTGFKGEAANIVLLKNTLEQELQKLGKDIYMNRYHKRPYKQYLHNKEEKQSLLEKQRNLEKTLAANSISFAEYQTIVKEKNLPMNISSEEDFLHHQEKVLKNLQEKIYIIEEKINSLSQTTPEMQKAEILNEELSALMNEKYKSLSKTESFLKMACLESILSESRESTTHMNALTFCVKMPLEQALQIQEIRNREQESNNSYYAHERTGNSYLILDKDTTCGLYDSWNGAGGLFDIHLIKDVTVPIKYIFSMDIDGALGYSIESIYGRGGDMWTNHSIKDIMALEPDMAQNRNTAALETIIANADNKQSQSETYDKNKDIPIKER